MAKGLVDLMAKNGSLVRKAKDIAGETISKDSKYSSHFNKVYRSLLDSTKKYISFYTDELGKRNNKSVISNIENEYESNMKLLESYLSFIEKYPKFAKKEIMTEEGYLGNKFNGSVEDYINTLKKILGEE